MLRSRTNALLSLTVIAPETGLSPAKANLLFMNYFDASVDPQEQSVILSAELFNTSSFTNNITVAIEFVTEKEEGGGSSQASLYYEAPNAVQTLLQNNSTANPNNTVLAGALPNLFSGNTAQQFQINSANCRAIGGDCAGNLSGEGSWTTLTNLDGIVTLGDETYSSVKTAQHEINEVLGVGGWGTILGDDQIVNEKTTIAMLDPYRYSAANTRSLTLDTTATAYLSFDKGLTNIANFNQSGNNSDYGDLTASPCYVQSYPGLRPLRTRDANVARRPYAAGRRL